MPPAVERIRRRHRAADFRLGIQRRHLGRGLRGPADATARVLDQARRRIRGRTMNAMTVTAESQRRIFNHFAKRLEERFGGGAGRPDLVARFGLRLGGGRLEPIAACGACQSQRAAHFRLPLGRWPLVFRLVRLPAWLAHHGIPRRHGHHPRRQTFPAIGGAA